MGGKDEDGSNNKRVQKGMKRNVDGMSNFICKESSIPASRF